MTSTKDRDYVTSAITQRVQKIVITWQMWLHDEYKRLRLPDKYDFMASSEKHDYVYGIDDRKGLAEDVER